MIDRVQDQKTETREHMRGGDGSVILRHLLAPEDSCGKFKLCAVLTLEPGCGIGEHAHMPDAEFCWLLEGELVIEDNGTHHTVYPGDAWICGNGAQHETKNCSDQKAVFLAVVVN